MSLFPYAMALALSFGATRLIGVVSRSVARLYRHFGLDLRNIGVSAAPVPTDIVACSIDLRPATFHKLQCDPLMLLHSVTRFGQLPLPEAGVPCHSHPPEAGARSEHSRSEASSAVCDNGTERTQATI
jgi:acyl homoserine lactone synthase